VLQLCTNQWNLAQIPEQIPPIKIKLLIVTAHHLREGISRYTCCQNTLPTSQSEATLVAQQPLPRCGRRQWTNNNQIALYSKLFVAELAHEVGCRHQQGVVIGRVTSFASEQVSTRACGAGTQFSGSGSSSRHLHFWLRFQPRKFLSPAPDRFGPINLKKNYCFLVQFAYPKNHVCWTGTQISDAGSDSVVVMSWRTMASMAMLWKVRVNPNRVVSSRVNAPLPVI